MTEGEQAFLRDAMPRYGRAKVTVEAFEREVQDCLKHVLKTALWTTFTPAPARRAEAKSGYDVERGSDVREPWIDASVDGRAGALTARVHLGIWWFEGKDRPACAPPILYAYLWPLNEADGTFQSVAGVTSEDPRVLHGVFAERCRIFMPTLVVTSLADDARILLAELQRQVAPLLRSQERAAGAG